VIAATVWDNISIEVGELAVKLHHRTNENAFDDVSMYYCGGYLYRYGITGVPAGTRVDYYIQVADKMGNVSLDPPNAPDSVYSFMVTGTSVEETAPTSEYPRVFSLAQNYPNPFNPSTTISFELPLTANATHRVSLVIYDVRGKLVREMINSELKTGNHAVVWNGSDKESKEAPSGIYFYRLSSGTWASTKKMILMR
jgi:hypothetical protein